MGLFDSFIGVGRKLAGPGDTKTSTQSGFGKRELQQFMKDAGNINSATARVDTTQEGFGPQFTSSVVDAAGLQSLNARNRSTDDPFEEREFNVGSNKLTGIEFSQDQVKGFIKAFGKRQDEVFQQRARPGISQTRLT